MSTTTATAPKTAPAKDEARFCACHCGARVAGKATFRQGHDARMVSLAVKATVAGRDVEIGNQMVDGKNDIQAVIDQAAQAIEDQFGKALSAKYNAAAMRAWERSVTSQRAKADRKAAKDAKAKGGKRAPKAAVAAAAEVTVPTEIKVGRWSYPARANQDGSLERNAKRDGSGEWVPVAV